MMLQTLQRILENDDLTAVFQPIVNLQAGAILGYEGLIRGPADTPLRSPAALFQAARSCGLSGAIEDLCRKVVIDHFVGLGLPGKLFLNVTPTWFLDAGADPQPFAACLQRAGLAPGRVVLELTEGAPVPDVDLLRDIAARYAALGVQVAIDDLGSGFSSLRLWSELRPAFVKVDMYFAQGIERDKVKLQFMRSLQDIARLLGTTIIAEGIETEAELLLVRELGIAGGQGFHIARPQAVPMAALPPERLATLARQSSAAQPHAQPHGQPAGPGGATALRLLRIVTPASPRMTNSDLFDLFVRDPELEVIPVVDDGLPIGLVTRRTLLAKFATQFIRELHGRKSCTLFMDDKPFSVDQHTALQVLSRSVVEAERRHLFNGFIITAQGRYLGMGTGHDLMREMTSLQISAARYANPLTGLPGNVPINDHIDRLIGDGVRFTACYFDLDNFKPFNDFYGYRKGDDVIQLTGRLLETHADPSLDFIGHIGGDDFLVLFESGDWEHRCRLILDAFAAAIVDQFDEADVRRGGYVGEDRRGQQVLLPLVTLSIGAVRVEPGQFLSHLQISAVASEAKKQAKRITGNSMFVERRHGAATPR